MILFQKKYKYIFLVIVFVLFYRYDLLFFQEIMDDSVGEVFLMHLFGGSYDMEKIKLSVSVLNFIGLVYLDLLFSDYIVENTYVNGEYIFSRYSNRFQWYIRKIAGTFLYSNLGVFLYIFPYIINAITTSECKITQKDVQLMLCTYIMLVLFTYFSIIVINLLVLKYGNTISFLIFYSCLILSTIGILLMQENGTGIELFHRLNPMSNILVSWNFNNSYVKWGMGYYLFLGCFMTFLLWRSVRRIPIGVKKKEGAS